MSYSHLKIDLQSLVKMLQSEKRADYYQYRTEIDSPLSRICDSADALGPLIVKEKISFGRLRLCGRLFYSRFRPGDGVEIRTQKLNSDFSQKLSYGWKVDEIIYPEPGQIEVIISNLKPDEISDQVELFLFRSSSALFQTHLIKKVETLSRNGISPILGTDRFTLNRENSEFRQLFENLNSSQKKAVEYLIDHNLNGAIQGPPGTGKTQLLRAVIALALKSNMKVMLTSFTNAAVDNLLGRIVQPDVDYDWVRVGNADRVRREMYPHFLENQNFVMNQFTKSVCEANLLGATLHKLAYNSKAPQVDLMVIDEAGQVPIYFWPFIQRLAKRVILVGDQYQLPPVLSSQHADLPFDNVFSFCIDSNTPMLDTQYRMRREIQSWSSEKFYKGQLVPHVSVEKRDYFEHSSAFITDGFVVSEKFEHKSEGTSSKAEADFIANKVQAMLKAGDDIRQVGVICPYRAQAGVVNAMLQNRLGVQTASQILVDTVERFQGQEREAIFLSLGISGNIPQQLDFLSNPRRLNVSVTRAKSRFFCLADQRLLSRSQESESDDLNEFLRWVSYGNIRIKRAA